MERMPDDPRQEIAVALAGPAVNLVIAFGLWLWLAASSALVPVDQISLTGGPFLERLMVINIFLAVQGLALWMGFLGLFYNPFLIFIALFVWIGAAAEAGMEQIKSTLSDVVVGRAMLTDFQVLSPDDPLSHAIELTLAGSQKEFPVLVDAAMVGVLGQTELLKGLQSQGEQARVGDWMEREVQSADIDEPLEKVLERLQNCHCPFLAVTEAGQLAGIVNLDNIMELIKIQTALQEQDGRHKFGA
jgi:CBS domain-containing protein